MKKILVIVLAILLVIPFASCGSKSEDILSKVLDYAKEEELDWLDFSISYDDFEYVEEELSEYGIDGTVTMYAWVESDDFETQIYEFEDTSDAKKAQKIFEDDEWMEEKSSDGDYIVVRKGNIVVFGQEDMVEYITK